MNIESIVLRQIQVKLKAPFETSFGKTWERRVVLVEVIADGLSGWGEVTAGEGPFYNSETNDTSWLILEKFIVPLVSKAKITSPTDIPDILRVIRGHGMAKAALENALWDIEAAAPENFPRQIVGRHARRNKLRRFHRHSGLA